MRQVISAFRSGAAEDGPILAGVGVLWVAMLAILAIRGVSGFRPSGYLGNLLLYVLTLGVMSVFVLGSLLFRHRPKSPISFLWSQVASTSWMARIARGFPMLVVVAVLIPAFSAMKSSIPLFNPYSWDPVWIAADRAIHGTDAWRLLQPVAGFPIVTSLLSVAYHAWLFIVYAGSAYFCIFPRDRELRARYLISYFACWTIIGVAMAIIFASVGPCFLAPLTGDHHFDPLMSYLYSANQQHPVFVLPVQEQLLAWQQQNDHGLATGISAMPSMHVSMAMLFALSISKISRAVGAAAWLFVATIMIASVHLAYHYAVDGYVAILMTLAIWTVAKPLSRMVVNRPADTFQQAQAGLIGTAAT